MTIFDEDYIWSSYCELLSREFSISSIAIYISHSLQKSLTINKDKTALIRHSINADHICDIINSISLKNFKINNNTKYDYNVELYNTNTDSFISDTEINYNKCNLLQIVSVVIPFSKLKGISLIVLIIKDTKQGRFKNSESAKFEQIVEVVHEFESKIRPIMTRNRYKLSPREKEILSLSAGGFLAKEIAAHLGIQTKTVYNTLERARNSLFATNTMEALAKAYVFDLI